VSAPAPEPAKVGRPDCSPNSSRPARPDAAAYSPYSLLRSTEDLFRPRTTSPRRKGRRLKSFAPALLGENGVRLAGGSALLAPGYTRQGCFWQAGWMPAPEQKGADHGGRDRGPESRARAAGRPGAPGDGGADQDRARGGRPQGERRCTTSPKRTRPTWRRGSSGCRNASTTAVVVEVGRRQRHLRLRTQAPRCLDEEKGETNVWTLVGSTEANLAEGRLSAESPIGRCPDGRPRRRHGRGRDPARQARLQGPEARFLALPGDWREISCLGVGGVAYVLGVPLLTTPKEGLLMNEGSLSGWWVFAGVLLIVAGVLNIIYGIAAIGGLEVLHRQRDLHHQQPPHVGLGQPDPRGAGAGGGVLTVRRPEESSALCSASSSPRSTRSGPCSRSPPTRSGSDGHFRPLDHHRLQAGRGARRSRVLTLC